MSAKYDWEPRKRDYQAEQEFVYDESSYEVTQTHPLSVQPVQDKKSLKSSSKTFNPLQVEDDEFTEIDPLTTINPLSPTDPLSPLRQSTSKIAISGQLNRGIGEQRRKDFLNWNLKKAIYLKQYTTDKSIPIISVCELISTNYSSNI